MRSDIVWIAPWGGADISLVEDVEKKLGKKFPSDYVAFVTRMDGAMAIGVSSFKIYCNFEKRVQTYGFGLLHAFGKIESKFETMLWSIANPPYEFPDYLISFSRDGGGNLLCFDYRHGASNPEIIRWNIHAEPGTGEEVSYVSKSFSELLDMLFKE